MLDIPLHYDWVQCVEFSPDNSRILSSSSGSIKVSNTCTVYVVFEIKMYCLISTLNINEEFTVQLPTKALFYFY